MSLFATAIAFIVGGLAVIFNSRLASRVSKQTKQAPSGTVQLYLRIAYCVVGSIFMLVSAKEIWEMLP